MEKTIEFENAFMIYHYLVRFNYVFDTTYFINYWNSDNRNGKNTIFNSMRTLPSVMLMLCKRSARQTLKTLIHAIKNGWKIENKPLFPIQLFIVLSKI